MLTRRMVLLSLRPGLPPTTLMERSNSRTTLLVSWDLFIQVETTHVFFYIIIIEGLKLELLTSLLPSVNEKAAKINATYKKPNVHTVATLDVFKVLINLVISLIHNLN